MASIGPTLDEARRAIYLDFEGTSGDAPALLGTLWVSRQGQAPMVRQYVLDPALRPLAVPPLVSASLAGELRSLLGRAERQHRVLIGWSGHEVEIVREHCPELVSAFEAVYRDAKVPAKAWGRLRGLRPAKDARKRRHRLATYEVAAGVLRPEELGPKDMAKAIRGAGKAVRNGDGTVNGKALARWERMIAHNELDCRATRQVTLRALEELAAEGSPLKPRKPRTKEAEAGDPATVDGLLLAEQTV